MEKIKLVILGGGLAGLPLALHIEKDKLLASRLDVLMIDQRDYFEMNCESVRFLVKPEIHSEFVAHYSTYLNTTRFMCASIRVVQQQYVEVLREGQIEQIPYDYLVVALGTNAQTIPQRVDELMGFSHSLQAAQRILVVGGRTVGVEFVGEVLAQYPEKEVIVVHSGPSLLDEWPKCGIDLANKYLQNKRLTIVSNIFPRNYTTFISFDKENMSQKKVVNSEGTRHELSDGTFIEADLKVIATGMVPNSEPLQPLFDDALSKNKYLRVQPTLQVQGHPNVFALGDIIDLLIPKLAANIRKQKKVIVKNLRSMVLGKPPKCGLKSSKLQTISLVSIGPSYAIMSIPVVKGVTSFIANSAVSHVKTQMFIRLTKTPTLL